MPEILIRAFLRRHNSQALCTGGCMLVRAWYPVSFESNTIDLRSHPSHEYIRTLSREDAHAYTAPVIEAAWVRDSNIFLTGPAPQNHFGPFGATFSGEPVPNPPDKVFTRERISTSHENFEKRVEAGEILVSDLSTGQIHATYNNGSRKGSVISDQLVTKNYSYCGLWEFEEPHWARNGGVDFRGQFTTRYVLRTDDVGVNPYDVGWTDDVFNDIFSLIPDSPNESEYGEIMSTTADANRGTLDLATAMAEMPQTLRSILEGCKTVLRLYRDARNKEIRLRNLVKGPKNSSATAHKQWKKDYHDMLDAVASVWLNYRYNIQPTVLTIVDALKIHEDLQRRFVRWRGNVSSAVPLDDLWLPEGWSCESELSYLFRVFIKRSIGGGDQIKLGDILQTNAFVTAWELIPLSFVVDWVLNVGNAISVFTTPSFQYEEGATVSWRVDTDLVFLHKESGASVHAKVKCYNRRVITPSDYCRVLILPDISPVRQLDAAALSWKMFIQKVFK